MLPGLLRAGTPKMVLSFCSGFLLCALFFLHTPSLGYRPVETAGTSGTDPAPSTPPERDTRPQRQWVRPHGGAAATRETSLLQVSLEDLREPALPGGAWFTDPACARYRTWFARTGSLPDARLASFFRSGNTWTRYLLEAASGLATCGGLWKERRVPPRDDAPLSVAEIEEIRSSGRRSRQMELLDAGFIGEDMVPGSRNCLVLKSHGPPPPWRSTRDPLAGYRVRAVFLVRDPFRAIISLRHFEAGRRVLLNESEAAAGQFAGDEWRRFVETSARQWFSLAADWAAGPAETLLVPYELLERQTRTQLEAMLAFLGVVPDPGRLRCALRHSEGRFHNRRHPVVPDRTVFDRGTRTLVWDRIHELHDLLQSRGYSGLPLHLYSFADEHSAGPDVQS